MQANSTFRTILSFFALMLLSNTVAAGVVAAKTLGCRDALKTKEGADVSFYSYEYGSKLSQHEDFFSKLYLTKRVHSIPSYLGLVQILHQAHSSKPEMGQIYGFEITFTNFTAVITGYYFPEETGKYTFTYPAPIGGTSLRVGAGVESCTGFFDDDITDDFALKSLGAPEGESFESFTTYLEGGVAYPVEMIINNWEGHIFINPILTVPNGSISKFEGRWLSQIKQISRE